MSSGIAGPSTSAGTDDDVQMLDSSSAARATLPTTAQAVTTIVDDDDGEDGDEPEDEYEIEYIVSHSTETGDGQASYFVKWKGYPDSENSWVFASDMGGAQEMINEYWAKNRHTVKKMGTKGKSPRKRGSSVMDTKPKKRRESSIANGGEAVTKSKSRQVASRSPTPDGDLMDDSDPVLERIRSDPALDDEQRSILEQQHLNAVTLERLRKKYARIPDWDPIVRRIEAVEKMSNDRLKVFVLFEDGDRLAFESAVVHHRCPLKLLQFYEANLRFKRHEEDGAERSELRGEERMDELEAYRASAGVEGEQEGGDATTGPAATSVGGNEDANGKGVVEAEAVPKPTGEKVVEEEETMQPEAEVADQVSTSAALIDGQQNS